MPFINGRFYMNPAYGRALEQARSLESGQNAAGENVAARSSDTHTSDKQGTLSEDKEPQAEHETRIANRVYNETGGLRPKPDAKSGAPGSAEDLHKARVAISHVAQNREKSGRRGGIAPDRASSVGQKTPQYKDSHAAAIEAAHGPDVTGGSEYFYLDYGQRVPNWAQGKKTTSYGPFENAAGGGDVPKGDDVRIVVVH